MLETAWESRWLPDYGGLAQLGEHLPCKQGVESSNLLVSTKAMRSGFHGTEDECACTEESYRDRKERANARDEVSFAYESHAELFPVNESTFAVCTLKTEYRIKHQTMRNVSKETFHGDRDKTSKSKSKRKQARKKP